MRPTGRQLPIPDLKQQQQKDYDYEPVSNQESLFLYHVFGKDHRLGKSAYLILFKHTVVSQSTFIKYIYKETQIVDQL